MDKAQVDKIFYSNAKKIDRGYRKKNQYKKMKNLGLRRVAK